MSSETFLSHRPLLFALAYRMLGSVADAEDVLQDTWLRFAEADEAALRSPRAWLATVATRLCLDRLKSARAQRERYVGPWLPEPLLTPPEAHDLPESESVSLAFLLLLERLSPVERAVYLLREVFDHSHAEVAEIIGKEVAACRQIHHRACERIKGAPRFKPTRADHERLLQGFLLAVSQGDVEGLTRLLAADATLWSDGGGKVLAARKLIHGGPAIARFYITLVKKHPPAEGQRYDFAEANGSLSLIGRLDGRPNLVLSIDTDGTSITTIYNVLSPDKLRLLER